MTWRQKTLGISVALVVLAGPLAWAQAPNGMVRGVVRDGTGTAVPAVTITATNQATNASQTATTASDGSYSLSLPLGAYRVVATLPGFRRVTQAVDVASGASIQLDFSLDVALSEAVTVTATKREETLLDVPFSVAAPIEETLRARGVATRVSF